MRRKWVISTALLIAAVLGLAIIDAARDRQSGTMMLIGTVSRVHSRGEEFWGLTRSFTWRHPLRHGKFQMIDLPPEFQVDGLRVRCECRVYDVVSPGSWGVVLQPVRIQKATS